MTIFFGKVHFININSTNMKEFNIAVSSAKLQWLILQNLTKHVKYQHQGITSNCLNKKEHIVVNSEDTLISNMKELWPFKNYADIAMMNITVINVDARQIQGFLWKCMHWMHVVEGGTHTYNQCHYKASHPSCLANNVWNRHLESHNLCEKCKNKFF